MKLNTALTPASQLEAVAQRFSHWRATREKRSRIPDELLSLIPPLMNQYTQNEIATALKINHSQLKKRISSTPNQQMKTTFLEFSAPRSSLATGSFTMEFTCKNGTAIKIGGLVQSQLQPLISLLIGN